jgi:hypothetical protein
MLCCCAVVACPRQFFRLPFCSCLSWNRFC